MSKENWTLNEIAGALLSDYHLIGCMRLGEVGPSLGVDAEAAYLNVIKVLQTNNPGLASFCRFDDIPAVKAKRLRW